MPRKLSLDAVLAIAGILLIGIFAALQSGASQDGISAPSTYDYGANGFAALYALLDREHVPVSRFESPLVSLQSRGTLALAGDEALLALALDSATQKGLDQWVREGGTLALIGAPPLLDRSMFGLPKTHRSLNAASSSGCGVKGPALHVEAAFEDAIPHARCTKGQAILLERDGDAYALAYPRGKGAVIFVSSTEPFDNAHLTRADNAAFAYAVFAGLGTVQFDERAYGYANDKSMWEVLPQPVHIAIIIALGALLLAVIGANLPFAPAVDLRERHVRNTREYLQSLAAMLRRGRAQADLIRRYCAEIRRVLQPHGATAAAAELLREAERIEQTIHPRDEHVLAAAQLYARVRKDYPW